jgi:hypothetical protein
MPEDEQAEPEPVPETYDLTEPSGWEGMAQACDDMMMEFDPRDVPLQP